MLEIITVFLVYLFSLNIAAFVSVGILTLFFQVKKRIAHMERPQWNAYFEKIGPRGMLARLYICYMLALGLLDVTNYFSFFNQSMPYTITLLIAGLFHLTYKYQLNKEQLKNKFQ